MLLDIRTLIFCNLLITSFIGLLLLFYKCNQKTYPGFNLWVNGVFLVALGYLALGTREFIPVWLSIMVSNGSFALGMILRFDGAVRFMDAGRLARSWYALPMILLALDGYFYIVRDVITLRALFLSLLLSTVMLLMARLFITRAPQRNGILYRGTGVLLALAAALLLLRSVLWLADDQGGLFDPTLFNHVYFPMALLLEIGVCLSFVVMTGQRLESELHSAQERLTATLEDLRGSMEQIKILSGLLPICLHCKKIKGEEGTWQRLETYLKAHSHADFSHGVCPECQEEHYPELLARMKSSRGQ